MWIIQNDSLLSIPDDAPMPPNSAKVELPEDFKKNPTLYRIHGSKLERGKPTKASPASAHARLTREDIAKLKKAIERGDIK